MKIVDLLAAVLLIIGGLNWGLIGLFSINPVDLIFSHSPLTARIIYIIVGLAAVYRIFFWNTIRERWKQ